VLFTCEAKIEKLVPFLLINSFNRVKRTLGMLCLYMLQAGSTTINYVKTIFFLFLLKSTFYKCCCGIYLTKFDILNL